MSLISNTGCILIYAKNCIFYCCHCIPCISEYYSTLVYYFLLYSIQLNINNISLSIVTFVCLAFTVFKTGFQYNQPNLVVIAIAEFEKYIEKFPKCLTLRALYGQVRTMPIYYYPYSAYCYT